MDQCHNSGGITKVKRAIESFVSPPFLFGTRSYLLNTSAVLAPQEAGPSLNQGLLKSTTMRLDLKVSRTHIKNSRDG